MTDTLDKRKFLRLVDAPPADETAVVDDHLEGDSDIPSPSAESHLRFAKQVSSARELMPECHTAWFEKVPSPTAALTSLDDIEQWIETGNIPIALNSTLEVVVSRQTYYTRRPSPFQRKEVTLGELANPKKRAQLFPNRDAFDSLKGEILAYLNSFTLCPSVRREMFCKRERFEEAISQCNIAGALVSLWERVRTTAFRFPKFESHVFVGGIETDSFIYRFSAIDTEMYIYGRRQADVVQIGLWGDSAEETAVSCLCGGNLANPCGHLMVAIERLLDGLVNPEHVGHAALMETLSKPMWAQTLKTISTSALFRETRDTPVPSARVVWRISRYGNSWALEAAKQTLGKSGRWSKGRRVEPYRLALDSNIQMTDIDRRVSAVHRLKPFDWMDALTGHPLVFFEAETETPLKMVRSSLKFSVVKENENLAIGFFFGGRHLSAREIADVLSVQEGLVAAPDSKSGMFFFTPVSRDVVNLIISLKSKPTRIPAAHTQEVLDAVLKPSSAIDVHLDGAFGSEDLPANLVPVIRLTPQGETGLSIAVGFHLFSDGHWTIPGEGAEIVVRGIGGRPVRLVRDFEQEQRIAVEIASKLNLNALQIGTAAFEYLAMTVDDTAELLCAVRELALPHTVEWPRDKTPWTVSEIGSHNAKLRISERRGALFEIGLDTAIDNEKLSIHDLADALETGAKYLRIGPGRFAKIEEHLRSTAENIHAVSVGKDKMSLHISKAAAAALMDRLSASPLEISADSAWKSYVSKLEAVRLVTPKIPDVFNGELRGYQKDGFAWLSRIRAMGFGACLADDMGLGKTIQALALLLEQNGDGPSIVVAPTSVAPNWMREVHRFAPTLTPIFHHGQARNLEVSTLTKTHLIVTTYDILVRDIETLSKIPFEIMIIDEAQAVKNAAAKRAAAVREIDSKTKIALTGTPIENHLGELWSIFDAVVPGLLGNAHQFQRRFAAPIQKLKSEAHRKRLAALIRPFVLRRTKLEAAPELPPRTETVRFVELYEEERRQYEIVRRSVLTQLESGRQANLGEKDRFNILAQITKLRRMACHPRLNDESSLIESAKLDTVEELIADILSENERALIFSQFVGHLALVRERLDKKKIAYFYLDGATPAEERGRLMDVWLEGQGSLFLISLKAGGFGLNLTGADYVLHLDPWWNPAVEDQATDRTHRIGQTKPVTVVRVIASATIEEAVIALHEKKRALAESILTGAGEVGALSTDALIELIRTGNET